MPAILAHRGASRYAPENTLAAFRLAMEQRADGIELDVHLTADQEVVVIHDAELSRTTNGHGLIQNYSLAEARQLDAGGGEPIPTLNEVLALVRDQVVLNIELKGFSGSAHALPGRVLKLLQTHGLQENIIISSFDPRLLFGVKRLAPRIRIGLLYPAGIIGQLKSIFAPLLKPYSLHPHFSAVTPRLLRQAKKHHRPVFAWTVNQPEDIQRLFQIGIDGIITDDPQTARQVREKLQ